MKKMLGLAIGCALLFSLSRNAAADCVSDMFASTSNCGYGRDGSLIIIQDHGFVTHTRLSLYRPYMVSSLVSTSPTTNGEYKQLFNDRYSSSQPFPITAGDRHTVTITSGGNLTIDNITWSFSEGPFAVSCHGDQLYAYSGSTLYVVAWRSLINHTC